MSTRRVLAGPLRMDEDMELFEAEDACMFEGGADSADTDPTCGICLECAADRSIAPAVSAPVRTEVHGSLCENVLQASRGARRDQRLRASLLFQLHRALGAGARSADVPDVQAELQRDSEAPACGACARLALATVLFC